jgi:hypothetical protein
MIPVALTQVGRKRAPVGTSPGWLARTNHERVPRQVSLRTEKDLRFVGRCPGSRSRELMWRSPNGVHGYSTLLVLFHSVY